MNPLFVTYALETSDSDPDRALTIRLQQREGETTPTHELLSGLHKAMGVWDEAHPEVFVSSDLGIGPPDGAVHGELSDYLYADGAINKNRLGRHLTMLLDWGRLHTFSLRPGSPVEGRDLAGRSATLTAMQQRLVAGSVHLSAPRRYGKTSILRQLKKEFSDAGRACIYIDVSPCSSAQWFLVTVVQEAMKEHLCRPALLELPELSEWPEPGAAARQTTLAGRRLKQSMGNVRNVGRRIVDALGTAGAILLVDEFSVFLRGTLQGDPVEAGMISEILKGARQGSSPTCQVLAGSAGLSSFIRFQGLAGLFDDLHSEPLGPLAEQDAVVLIEELLYGSGQAPTPEIVSQVLTEVGAPIPYFLHVLVDAIRDQGTGRGQLDAEAVRRAYEEGVLSPRGNSCFREYRLVNQPYPTDLLQAAGDMLLELAQHGDGLPEERLREIFAKSGSGVEGFQNLLACLQEDYDLVERAGGWVMRSKVLRDRWAQDEPWLTGEEHAPRH